MATREDIQIEEAFEQRPMSKALFTRLFSYVRPYRRVFWINLLFTVLATAASLAGPKLVQVGIDRHLTHMASPAAAAHGMLIISLLFLGTLLLGWLLSAVQVRTAIAVGQGAMNDLRLEVFAHIQSLSLSYFDRTHHGRIINRADTDIDSLDRVLTWGATQVASSALMLVGVLALMLRYDWRLSLAVSIVLPPLAIATRIFHRRGMDAYRRMRQQSSKLTASLAENISGVRVVQAFVREDLNLAQFQSLHQEYGARVLVAAKVFHTYMPFVGLMSGIGTAIILGYGGSLVLRHEISVGELAAFVLYLGMFFGPVQTMGDLYNAVLSAAASAERIFQLLDTKSQVADRADARPLPEIQGHVRFEKVSFRYDTTPPGTWVLEDIDFEALAGQTVALVGATGSGKTSIVSLAARFYEPQQGRILIDGRDLMSTTVDSLRRQIGIVTQENFLFSGTVLDNLRFGRPGATDDEVFEAAKALGTHDRFLAFPKGYATDVAERGSNLSAGERQLLCFTRAMVARPRILILDEATSAVDPRTEAAIQQALERLLVRRTCFVIAHRLSTVRHADLILVLERGKIVERGDHETLAAAGGHYARMLSELAHRPTPLSKAETGK